MPGKSARISWKQKKSLESVSESHFDPMVPRFRPIVPESLEARWAWLWEPLLRIELRNQGASLIELSKLQLKHQTVLTVLCMQGVSMRTIKRWNLDDPRMNDRERQARVRVHLERSAAHYAKSRKNPVDELQNPALLTPEARSMRFLRISLERMQNADRDKNREAIRRRKQISAMLQTGDQLAAQINQRPLTLQRRTEKTKPSTGEPALSGPGLYHGIRVWRPKRGVAVVQEDGGVRVL